MKRILLIEDEDVILKALRRLLERNHYAVTVATTVEAASELQPSSFDLVLADLRLPGEPGTTIIPAADPVPVIIMTSHASVRSAVDAMRSGAIDYIAKPFDHDELLMVIGRSLMQRQMHAQNRALKLDLNRLMPVTHYLDHPITTSILQKFDGNNTTRRLHLYGESGCHREVIARALHTLGEQADAPLVVLDANTINKHEESDTLSEYLQIARNGTLVIRYPEKLTENAQTLLAETIELDTNSMSQSSLVRHLDVDLITLSQFPLDRLLSDNSMTARFKALLTNEYSIPPLRQRRQDIIPLATQAIAQAAERRGINAPILSDSARSVLEAYDWPGNMTELEQLIQDAVKKATSNIIDAPELGFNDPQENLGSLDLEAYFRYAVLRHQGQMSETELAAMLGISRKALWERRQKMHLLRGPGDS